MPAISSTDVVQALADHSLLKPSQLQELKRLPQADTKALVQTLVQRGWLTAYQAKLLLQGQAAELVVGPYVILEPLGEGGMGHIFKGRHPGRDRLAAIKLLRRDLVADKELLQRFLREIKLASQLPKHPHLVHAFDAGATAGTHYLAMEYVEGVDLDRLVKQAGPLSVPQACDYIRQVALGLQHAHEHGLVHRDIKPANLLVTKAQGSQSLGTVKVVDLGLARLQGKGTGPGQTIVTLTSDGTMTMGTVDYMAPEQALDLHRADIRADIYSLGCTFYYLLTGKPPFGDGPLAVRLMRHQQAEPPDLSQRRPDVPAALIPIVRRMLAKKPEDRYQTPGEVAAALAALLPRYPFTVTRTYGKLGWRVPAKVAGAAGKALGFAARQAWHYSLITLGAAVALLVLATVLWLLPAGDRFSSSTGNSLDPATSMSEHLARQSPLDLLDPARITSKVLKPDERPVGTVAVMTGHRLAENYIKFSPNARFLAVCGDNTHKELTLYDLAGPEPKLYALTGHTSSLYLVAFSPDSKLVVSLSNDHTARRWSLATLPPRFVGQNLCSSVNSVVFSPNGELVASATSQTVYVSKSNMVDDDDHQPQARAQLVGLTGPLAFTREGRLLACRAPQRQTIHLLDLTAQEPTELAVLPVGANLTRLALADAVNHLATGDVSTGVKVWDLNRMPPVPKTLATASQDQHWTTGIRALAITRDGKATAAATNYGYMRIWDLSGSEPKERAQLPPAKSGESVARLIFSPDGKTLASVSADCLRLWDVVSGRKLREWNFDMINTMDFAPDGRHIAVGSGNHLYILRLGVLPAGPSR